MWIPATELFLQRESSLTQTVYSQDKCTSHFNNHSIYPLPLSLHPHPNILAFAQEVGQYKINRDAQLDQRLHTLSFYMGVKRNEDNLDFKEIWSSILEPPTPGHKICDSHMVHSSSTA